MERTVVDARGKPCPLPVVMARKALANLAPGAGLEIVVDDPVARQNVCRYLDTQGISAHVQEKSGDFRIMTGARPEDAAHETHEQAHGGHAVCVKSNRMGHGDDDLGDVLIRAFLNVLDEIQPLPSSIVFYNSGITLALKDSPVLASLRQLEDHGVRILVCGTCLNHFGQKENIGVGAVSNMYDIAEALARASHVVVP
ncbi:MAG: sulfurtransferase-like selenium metabolism protein YedF [Chitinivibrionales bacterium]|nr:sulfurtransferase-like selenium metabolism protein YedF [Chitinivibrionales bacterium]MBD3395590.1 sulfurtransferase-like selenium metabolism protein YedF [Chitinivibrionales bacterium]